jgi:hypothetical protein
MGTKMPRQRDRVCLQDGLKLDLNRLVRNGFVRGGANIGLRGIKWTHSYWGDIASGLISADMTGQDEGWFRIHVGSLDQWIILVPRPRHFGGRQWYFMCPVRNRPASVLWKPPGATRFCSRQTWGRQVAYGSQFIGATDRAHNGKARIADTAFVSTNSICQGRIVPILWPKIFESGAHIHFAHTSFKWANLASHNAGVTVAIVGLSGSALGSRRLFDVSSEGETTVREAVNITPYLTIGENVIVTSQRRSIAGLHDMSFGNMPVDGGNLLMTADEVAALGLSKNDNDAFIRRIYGSAEFIRGLVRYCLWLPGERLEQALEIEAIRTRVDCVRTMRLASKDAGTREMASRAHQFREMNEATGHTLMLPGVSSEGRQYLPVGLLDNHSTISNLAFALYDAPLWNMALIASRLHLVWIATVCGKMKTDFRYSNTLGWNTFPIPLLTEKNKADLSLCAKEILLMREANFPATIADLYNPHNMPADLREAHERNDEVLERIYIGRRFRNDTERLEKLFELYTKMTAGSGAPKKSVKAGASV